MALFPLLGVASIREATAPYANPLIFLFLGGFLIGLGIQRFGLHRRIALLILLGVGSSPRALIGGFMLASALLSMWISNTATAIMMLPIGASVLRLLEEHRDQSGGVSGTPAEMDAFATALVVCLTEITSNTAVTTTLMPVLAATAVATDQPPGMLLTAAALAASCAFMLPVATPPNAIVFSSGLVTVGQMARAGLGLNLIAILILTLAVSFGARLVLITMSRDAAANLLAIECLVFSEGFASIGLLRLL